MVFRYVAWDRTFYEDVMRLPPGHIGIWEAGRLSLRRYWSPSRSIEHATLNLDEAVEQLGRRWRRRCAGS